MGPVSRGVLLGWAFGMLGIQFCWSIQIGYVTRGLLEIGLRKEYVSLAWLAGPIAGIVIQPLVGRLSDRWESRFGRRRPFIVGGVLVALVSLMMFGYADRIGEVLGDGDVRTRGEENGTTAWKERKWLVFASFFLSSLPLVQAIPRQDAV